MSPRYRDLSAVCRRRVGAPDGNTNALKHGYYARKLPKPDRDDIPHQNLDSLVDEIVIVKAFIQRMVACTDHETDLETSMTQLRILSIATLSLTRLLRTQMFLQDQIASDAELAFSQALKEMIEDTYPAKNPLSQATERLG